MHLLFRADQPFHLLSYAIRLISRYPRITLVVHEALGILEQCIESYGKVD